MAQGIIYLPSVHTDCYLFFTSADVYDETDYLSRLYPPTYIITDINKTKNVKCSHFSWIVSYDCMRLRAHDTYACLLQTAQKRCFCINSKEFGWVQVPFSLFGSVCLDIILLSKTPRGNISTKRQSSVIKLSWNRDEVSGIDWLSLCLDAAVAWMSRTGYESIWQGWDRARGQRNRLVRWAQTAIFSFRFFFLMLVICDTYQMKKASSAWSSSSWTLVTWSDAAGAQHLQPSPSSGPMQGPEGTLCKRQSKPGEPPRFPTLLEKTGQDLILRDSYMAPLLKQLKIKENVGKGDVCHSMFWLCPIFFFALYFIHPEGTVSQPYQIVSFLV